MKPTTHIAGLTVIVPNEDSEARGIQRCALCGLLLLDKVLDLGNNDFGFWPIGGLVKAEGKKLTALAESKIPKDSCLSSLE